jgi:hypothetical protein
VAGAAGDLLVAAEPIVKEEPLPEADGLRVVRIFVGRIPGHGREGVEPQGAQHPELFIAPPVRVIRMDGKAAAGKEHKNHKRRYYGRKPPYR